MAAYLEDTIVAIATAPGAGAISILRLSGRDAVQIASAILDRREGAGPLEFDRGESHRARRAQLVRTSTREGIDDVLVLPMLAPRSYTGEDIVEVHCHGGRVIAALALESAMSAGARSARPGEFTERAFLNGRLDLLQAEAVADMIAASSAAALRAAHRQLGGDLSGRVLEERDRILDTRALVEAHLDFPEEDLPSGVEEELRREILAAHERLGRLAASYDRGRLVRDGVRVVLVGRPNVGKSSLLNALLGRERALVSAEAGTTRDYLEEPLAIGDLEVLLYDTAGIRDGRSKVERAGVERSTERMQEADILVLVLDGSKPLQPADEEIWAQAQERPVVLVRNKADLPAAWTEAPFARGNRTEPIAISATEKTGLSALTAAIDGAAPTATVGDDELVVTNLRHHDGLLKSVGHLQIASELLGNERELELVAAELQLACHCLDELVGRSDNEDVLDRIFSKFCLGK